MVAAPTRKRFTVTEYEELTRLGFFHEDDRIELLDGEIIEMAAMGGDHATVIRRLNRLLNLRIAPGYIVDVQSPLRLDDNSMPEPDLAIVYDREYADVVPTAADALLVMEIADSSLDFDRNRKLPRYAATGIPEAWLFDVTARRMERHSAPRDGRYTIVEVASGGQELASTILPAVVIVAEAAFR